VTTNVNARAKVYSTSGLKHHIKCLLQQDRMNYFECEALWIEEAISSNKTKEGFQQLHKWYKRHSGVHLPMSHHTLSTVASEWTNLYVVKTPTRPMFNLTASRARNFHVYDEPLTVPEIHASARQMKQGKVPGPSKFCADTIHCWAHADLMVEVFYVWQNSVAKSITLVVYPNACEKASLCFPPSRVLTTFAASRCLIAFTS
jgi:hypothetical protein